MQPQNEFIEVTNQLGEKMSIEMGWSDDIWKTADKLRLILMFMTYPSIVIDKILPKGE